MIQKHPHSKHEYHQTINQIQLMITLLKKVPYVYSLDMIQSLESIQKFIESHIKQ
jgi:hypothetical protein